MAKTFDNIAEASVTNYLFLFAQRTLALQTAPPTPPPLNALGLPCEGMCRLWARLYPEQAARQKYLSVYLKSIRATGRVLAAAEEKGAKERAAMELKGACQIGSWNFSTGSWSFPSASLTAEKAMQGRAKKQKTFAEEITPLAEKVTQYILDHQDDAAQEDRWRTTMKRDMAKSFRAQREEVQKVKVDVQAMQRVVENIFELVNTKTASLEPLLIVQDDDVAPALGQPRGAPLQGHGRPALAHVDVYDC